MKKHIPNMITCCNLISGCIAVYWAFRENFDLALTFIVIGAVFDFFDGMTARLLGVSSPIGKELDSLADDITFGFAPSAIVFTFWNGLIEGQGAHCLSPFALPFLFTGGFASVAFIMAAFSALRLAKFNLDERQTMGFIGLPTPANALFWGAIIVGSGDWLKSVPYASALILLGVGLSCWLLVSEVPMFALKFKHWGWRGNEVRYLFLFSCIPLLLFFGITGIAIIIVWYVLLSFFTQRKPVSL